MFAKKILSIILSICIFAFGFTAVLGVNAEKDDVEMDMGMSEPNNQTALIGDVDGNKAINLDDLVLLAQYVAKWENLSVVESNLDINKDKQVDLNDVVVLAQYLAGWEGIELN